MNGIVNSNATSVSKIIVITAIVKNEVEDDIYTYFPAHKTHFLSRKMWPKFDLRLMHRG